MLDITNSQDKNYANLDDDVTIKTQSVECVGQIEMEEWRASIQ